PPAPELIAQRASGRLGAGERVVHEEVESADVLLLQEEATRLRHVLEASKDRTSLAGLGHRRAELDEVLRIACGREGAVRHKKVLRLGVLFPRHQLLAIHAHHFEREAAYIDLLVRLAIADAVREAYPGRQRLLLRENAKARVRGKRVRVNLHLPSDASVRFRV